MNVSYSVMLIRKWFVSLYSSPQRLSLFSSFLLINKRILEYLIEINYMFELGHVGKKACLFKKLSVKVVEAEKNPKIKYK